MSDLDPRFDPRFQRGYAGEEPQRIEVPAFTTPAAERQPGPDVEDGIEVADEALADALPANPWLTTLLVVSVAFVAAGLAVAWTSASQNGYSYTSATPPIDIFLRQLPYLLTTPFITGGLIGVVAWLVLRAARGSR